MSSTFLELVEVDSVANTTMGHTVGGHQLGAHLLSYLCILASSQHQSCPHCPAYYESGAHLRISLQTALLSSQTCLHGRWQRQKVGSRSSENRKQGLAANQLPVL